MVISIQRIGRVLQLSMGLSLGMALYSLYLWGQGKCTDVDLFLEGIYYTSGGAFAGGILLGLTTYGTKFFDGFRYYIHSGLRYGLVYMLVTYAMSVLLDISFPDSLMSLERKVADISSQDLVWVFFGHTYTYQAFIGWMQIAGCGLLLFRATAPAGLLIHLAIMSNVFIIQRSYGLCQQYEAIIYLATVTFLLLPFVRNLINVLLLNKPTITLERMEWAVGIHAYRATAVLKLILLMGIAILYYNKTRRFHRYYFANSNSPFIGVWNIDQIEYQPDQDSVYRDWDKIYAFQSLFLEKRRFGAVKSEDTLSLFEYMIDTKHNRIEFWNFHKYRSFDFKGNYKMIAPDTMLYTGMNHGDRMVLRLSLDKKYKTMR